MIWQEILQKRAILGRPFVMAHRGASAILPENTLSSFELAIVEGVDALETDLHFTKDEELVIIHDSTVNRTTDGVGAVQDMTLAELKKLKIKLFSSQNKAEERIPTLRELIEFNREQVPIVLELKDPRFAQPRYAEKLITLLDDYHVLSNYGVISFDLINVQTVKALNPSVISGWITCTNLWPKHPVELIGPLWPILLLNPFYVAWAHRLGKIVCPLDLWPEKRLSYYLRIGVDAVMTNNPKITIAELIRKIGKEY